MIDKNLVNGFDVDNFVVIKFRLCEVWFGILIWYVNLFIVLDFF